MGSCEHVLLMECTGRRWLQQVVTEWGSPAAVPAVDGCFAPPTWCRTSHPTAAPCCCVPAPAAAAAASLTCASRLGTPVVTAAAIHPMSPGWNRGPHHSNACSTRNVSVMTEPFFFLSCRRYLKAELVCCPRGWGTQDGATTATSQGTSRPAICSDSSGPECSNSIYSPSEAQKGVQAGMQRVV